MTTKFQRFLLYFFLLFISKVFSQVQTVPVHDLYAPNQTYDGLINLNDTNYTRILNGIIIKNETKINHIGNLKFVTDKEKIKELGIKTAKPLMIVNIKMFAIESKIDSILYSRADFIANYRYPPDIQLPIVVNGKLLSFEDRKNILPKLGLNNIKEINYLDSFKSNSMFNNTTPFGAIDVVL